MKIYCANNDTITVSIDRLEDIVNSLFPEIPPITFTIEDNEVFYNPRFEDTIWFYDELHRRLGEYFGGKGKRISTMYVIDDNTVGFSLAR